MPSSSHAQRNSPIYVSKYGSAVIKKGAPLSVGLRRRLATDGKEHPNEQPKVYWHGRTPGKHLDCGQRRGRKAADGVHHRNESSHHPGIHPGTAWELVGNVRG